MTRKQTRCSELVGRKFSGFMVLVVGLLLSGCASTTWYDEPPPMPVPVSPEVADSLGPAAMVTFSWEPTPRAETYDFHVFNAVNSDINQHMSRGLVPGKICGASVCSITMAVSLPASERHAWRVRATNVAGSSSWTRSLFTWVAQ